MLGTIVISVTLVILLWYAFVRPLSYWSKLGVKQSKPWILFGDMWRSFFTQTSYSDFVNILYNMYPEARYSGFYNLTKPVLVIKDPELIKQITVKDFECFTDHPQVIDPEADPLWSKSLVALKGERWKEMRNTLSPTFTSSKIKSIYVLMLETAENFVKHFLEKGDAIIETEMKDAYTRFTNDIIATTAFGIKVNSLEDQKNTFYEMGKKITQFKGLFTIMKLLGQQVFPKLFKELGFTFFDKNAAKYFYAVLGETIKVREENNIVRPDIIHLMLEARKDTKAELSDTGKGKESIKITNEDITSQAMIFFFAGFDTVSTAMCLCSYELAFDKDIQSRLRNEINEAQRDGKVSYEELMQMKYLDMVVSETLRKWPPFPSTDRVCTKPFTIEPVNDDEKPLSLPSNQEIWLPVHGIQRDPKYFPNPEKFDPERFSDENIKNIIPYTYLPFGVGPRSCIGNRFAIIEIKALLFNILLHFEIVPISKTAIPLKLSKDISQIPDEGIWLGLRRISSC